MNICKVNESLITTDRNFNQCKNPNRHIFIWIQNKFLISIEFIWLWLSIMKIILKMTRTEFSSFHRNFRRLLNKDWIVFFSYPFFYFCEVQLYTIQKRWSTSSKNKYSNQDNTFKSRTGSKFCDAFQNHINIFAN